MSFNKKYLPAKKELAAVLLKNGSSSFYRGFVKKVDAYIGPSESTSFIRDFVDKWTSTDEEFYSLG